MFERNDGYRIDIPATAQLMIDIKPKRYENEVYINREMDVTKLVDFIQKCKDEGKHYTFFHAFLMAAGKVIYNRQRMNYFVQNRHIYCHNDITLGFVAKIALTDHSQEVMMNLQINKNDTVDTISNKISQRIDKLRNHTSNKKDGANNAVDAVAKLPNIMRVPVMGVLKLLAKYGMMPKSILNDNIYFSSMIISNLGSIGCGAIYHNLSEFGNCSSLATMGEIKDVVKFIDNKQEVRKICEFGITLDERVGDGLYFSRSVDLMQKLLDHPEVLLQSIDSDFEF